MSLSLIECSDDRQCGDMERRMSRVPAEVWCEQPFVQRDLNLHMGHALLAPFGQYHSLCLAVHCRSLDNATATLSLPNVSLQASR